MTGWSEQCLNDPKVILGPHVPRDQKSGAVSLGNWRTVGSLPGSVGNMSDIWDPKDFVQRPYVIGTVSPSKRLSD